MRRTWTRSFCFESDRSRSRNRNRNQNRSRGNKNRSIGSSSRTDECWRHVVRRQPRRSSMRTGTVRRIAGIRITQPSPSTAAQTSRGCHQPLLQVAPPRGFHQPSRVRVASSRTLTSFSSLPSPSPSSSSLAHLLSPEPSPVDFCM